VSLQVVGRNHCPWRNPTRRNHTLSGPYDNLYTPCAKVTVHLQNSATLLKGKI
jgi:hypothetical protein